MDAWLGRSIAAPGAGSRSGAGPSVKAAAKPLPQQPVGPKTAIMRGSAQPMLPPQGPLRPGLSTSAQRADNKPRAALQSRLDGRSVIDDEKVLAPLLETIRNGAADIDHYLSLPSSDAEVKVKDVLPALSAALAKLAAMAIDAALIESTRIGAVLFRLGRHVQASDASLPSESTHATSQGTMHSIRTLAASAKSLIAALQKDVSDAAKKEAAAAERKGALAAVKRKRNDAAGEKEEEDGKRKSMRAGTSTEDNDDSSGQTSHGDDAAVVVGDDGDDDDERLAASDRAGFEKELARAAVAASRKPTGLAVLEGYDIEGEMKQWEDAGSSFVFTRPKGAAKPAASSSSSSSTSSTAAAAAGGR